MKSYSQHLKSTREFGEETHNRFSLTSVTTKKPILRSSGVFPVIQNQHYSSSIHFLGYWLLKRNIPEVTLVITLRNADGKTLLKKTEIIDVAKAFSVNLSSLLLEIDFDTKNNFLGSIETEFHSTKDMVFPYPALVLEYHNKKFNQKYWRVILYPWLYTVIPNLYLRWRVTLNIEKKYSANIYKYKNEQFISDNFCEINYDNSLDFNRWIISKAIAYQNRIKYKEKKKN